MTRLLAIESSQRAGAVALAIEDHIDDEPLRGRHDEDLVAAIDRLVTRRATSRADLDAVAVSIGPGGFTGLRVGIATAKMLAFALGVPALAVPTALVVAESIAPDPGGDLVVVLAVKDERFWATRLAHDGATWVIVGPPASRTADELDLGGVAVVAGDRFLPEAVRGAAGRVAEPEFSAVACARVALRMLARGEVVTAAQLAPIYARPPQVTVKGD